MGRSKTRSFRGAEGAGSTESSGGSGGSSRESAGARKKRARKSPPLWPRIGEMRELAERTEGRCIVLVTTGSYNPVHHGHIAMMEAAKKVRV